MKSNAWFAIVIFTLLSSLLFWQVKNVAALNSNGPISGPITSPVSPSPTPTPPITFPNPTSAPIVTPSPVVTPTPSPIPVREFILSGKVEYKVTLKIGKRQFSYKVPAVGVNVIAIRTYPVFGYETQTDVFGNYKFKLPALPSSVYGVSAYDSNGTRFEPAVKFVQLEKNTKNIDFQGVR